MSTQTFWNISTSNNIPKVRSLPVFLSLSDIFSLVVCLQFGFWLRWGKLLSEFNLMVCGLILLTLSVFYLADTYKPDSQIAGLRVPARIILCNAFVAGVSAALIYLSGAWRQNPLLWRSVLLPSLAIFTIWAVISRLWGASWVRSHAEQSRWLVLGTGDSTVKFVQDFQKLNPLGRLVVLTENLENINQLPKNSINGMGSLSDLPDWMSLSWSGVLVATEVELSDAQLHHLMQMRLRGIPVYKLPDYYESLWYKLPSFLLQDTWFIFNVGFNLMSSRVSWKLKRLIDTITALLLLVALSPLMLLVALAIKLDSPGSVFYSQLRTGLNSQPFRVYKFRSMYKDAEKRGVQWASQRDPRITRVGYCLRLTRIDELPQLWNVLRGEMSLIGPRPERPEFDAKLRKAIPYYDVRYLVKPGITGWAQVLYPYGASIEDAYEKLAYDLYYIKNYSFWLDLAIFFKTIRVVLLGKGR
ncbi:sugar transferase [Aetokthonos hydrillicola Thurmond2011]|jgi:exopolysaccharide biosynthesis polyprenyl glycosylphosphotransferase|uniref:Sugar transferase n=1 Tax=Aetokthonos hydrillicola Thurmond2011 TaxID=2712845 RepID=A0AAP5MBJ7_9CYAN|nr:sugar transferase [Aetokthonos hydrillicola]MBO3460276.1 sugar transferase [Aetokthonos hydrillicola CCALA 1050]MBW4587626.1 sugar transferase [Aetokthonos hydrillicola CCALA 1050]MDR9897992.1 sugar transferase [Aetokthonos hydrillicola Thurmond2011]